MKFTYVFLCVFIVLMIGACHNESKTNPPKPNILFIIADDLGYYDLSCTGSAFYETPHIDNIAAKGMVFTNGYAACQVCSPSRASVLTGMFPARHGITEWIGQKSGKAWRQYNRHTKMLPADYEHVLKDEFITLPEMLKQNGYKTFFAGKWHLGKKGSWPEDHGFEINKGGFEAGSPKGGYFSPFKNPNLSDEIKGENLSMRLAKETVNFIKKNRDSTFFAYLSFYAVHGPIQTTENKWRKYQQKAAKAGITQENAYKMESRLPIRQVQDNPVYAGLVESMDDAVGFVLDQLKAMGLDDNTIVVFTSDNGGVSSGDNFSTSNLPLRGGKGYQWEGGIREPYFIDVPWLSLQGDKCEVPVSGTDFYPTLLDLAGIPLQPKNHPDGMSLKPLLHKKEIAERALIWHYPHYSNQGGDPSSIIRRGDWKLIYYHEDGHKELYNLVTDLSESNDVSKQNPEIVTQLNKELQEYLNDVGALMPIVDKEYDAQKEQERYNTLVNEKLPSLERKRLQMLSDNWQPNASWWGSRLTKD